MGPSTGAGIASSGASSLEKTNSFSLQPITNSSSARVELRVYLHTLHAVIFVSLKGCARLLHVVTKSVSSCVQLSWLGLEKSPYCSLQSLPLALILFPLPLER